MKKDEISILIVDDDNSVRASLSEAVKRAGYRVVLAGKASEALSATKIRSVHAAVIDCMLPVMNGVDLAKKLRQKDLPKGPIIFFSGIFRDKAFAANTLKATNGTDFLYKPLDAGKIIEILDKHLENLIDQPKVALHSLLSKAKTSCRDRRKALDYVEEIIGYDLLLTLCIFMDSESSGYLNIVNVEGEIFGITLSKGKISKVDSSDTVATLSLLLIQNGFMSPAEIGEFQSKGKVKGDFLQNLVEMNLVSPHASSIVKREQMLTEIRRLVSGEVLKINFVLDRKMKVDLDGIDIDELITFNHQVLDTQVPDGWLQDFYHDWLQHPIRLGPQFSDSHPVVSLPIVTRQPVFVKRIKSEPTIEELLLDGNFEVQELYKAIHLFAIYRLIVFDEDRRVQNFAAIKSRLETLDRDLKGKDPLQVFHYFGAKVNPSAQEAERIYREFAKVSHPDRLPTNTPDDVRELNHKVFSLVTGAHDILTDEEKLKKFHLNQSQQEAEKQFAAEGKTDEAINLLKKGSPEQALEMLTEVRAVQQSSSILLHWVWAKIKSLGQGLSEEAIVEIKTVFAQIPHEYRNQSALYFYVFGIFKDSCGDSKGGLVEIEKSLELDRQFLEARRELNSIKSRTPAKMDTQDLLKADLGQLAKQFFKKRKK